MVINKATRPDEVQAYKPDEIAALLKVSVYTVHEWLRAGDLKGIRFKSRWRIMRADLDAFIESRRVEK